jgi:hypothetical protein
VGETLVHLEAAVPGSYVPGDYTFYGRYVAYLASDDREPLATTFAVPYVHRDDGRHRERTHLTVWRDTKLKQFLFACDETAVPFPLDVTEVIGFDEEENATDLLNPPFIVPPPPPSRVPFPAATQKVAVGGEELPAPAEAGWLYLNLNTTIPGDAVLPGVVQGWVTVIQERSGRQGVGFRAIPLDSAGTP